MLMAYPILMVLLLYLLGIGTLRVLKLKNHPMVRGNAVAPILVGFAAEMALTEVLGIFLPTNLSMVAVLGLAVGFTLWCFEDIKQRIRETRGIQWISLAAVAIPVLILMIPEVLRGELYISIGPIDDFGYYISSIDWLSGHSLSEPVVYNNAHPFYSMAEYMTGLTRLGMDFTGALIRVLFSLEAHEAFAVLVPVSAVLLMSAVMTVVLYFTGKDIVAVGTGLFAALCGNFISLVADQYLPQLFGVGFLILSLAGLYDVLVKENAEGGVFTGVMVSAMLAAYCEFTVHLLIGGIVLLVMSPILRKKICLPAVLKAVLTAVLFNVYGFYKAVSFNLAILSQVRDGGMERIDAFNGVMLGISAKLGAMFGINSRNLPCDPGIPGKVATVLAAAMALCGLVSLIRQKKKEELCFVLMVAVVVLGLEAGFLKSGAAYEEYKHLSSVAFLTITLSGVLIGWMTDRMKGRRIVTGAVVAVSVFTLICSAAGPVSWYYHPRDTMDSSVTEVREAAALVPDDKAIGIDATIPFSDHMGIAYALKDRALSMASGRLSYMHQFLTFEDEPSEYTLLPRSTESVNPDEVLWENERYILVHRPETDTVMKND